MKKIALSFVALVLLVTALGAVADAEDQQTLTGEYVWNGRSPGDLEAIFTAKGDNRWDVAFHFRFRGNAEIFSGTATGDLAAGKLEGKVRNGNGKGGRTFTFEGEFEDGTFRGNHAEILGSRASSTGTMTLKRKGRPGPEVL